MNHEADIGQIRARLQNLSRQAFSKMYRLEVAALVSALEPPIWARQVAKGLDIGENQAASELAEFERLGALRRFPSEYDRRKLYVVVPHWLWTAARAALDEGIRAVDPDNGDELVAAYWAVMLESEPRPLPAAGGTGGMGEHIG
jgi:hypothetical protein